MGTALQAASRFANEPVERYLLDKGADINAQGGESGNALAAAWATAEEILAIVPIIAREGRERQCSGGSRSKCSGMGVNERQ